MRVLYVLPVGERGGAERAVETWTAAHTPRVEPFVVMPPGPLVDRFRERGVRAEAPDCFRLSHLPAAVGYLRDFIRANRIDLVHSTMGKGHLFGALGALASGRPEVWFSHGPIAPRRWQGWIPLLPSAAVLVNSEYMRRCQAATWFRASELHTIPMGVDTAAFAPDAAARRRRREALGVDERTFVIGFFGRLARWKGQHVLLEALARAKDTLDVPVRACFVGGSPFGIDAEYRGELVELATRFGLGNCVHFTGHVDDVRDWLDASDAVVHGSTVPEPFGLVVAEAMAKARVVVATATGGPAETIEHDRAGFLYPAGDAGALARLLSRVAAMSTDARAAIGAAARASIVARHDVAVSVGALESLYADILARRESAVSSAARKRSAT
jgi:glycosyltransferase involved in cell wall biosynthesis